MSQAEPGRLAALRRLLRAVAKKIGEDEILTRSAALAFYTTLSMAPLVILTISFLSTLDLNLQEQMLAEVERLIGTDAQKLMRGVIERSNERPDLTSVGGWFGSLTLFAAASLIFLQIQKTLNLIFKAARPAIEENGLKKLKTLLTKRLASFGTVLIFILVAISSLVISSLISYFFGGDGLWIRWLSFAVDMAIFATIFAALFKWMPDCSLDTADSFLGGFLTALLFTIGKILIGLYIGQTAVGSAYGAAGSLVVLLVWMYYSSFIIFIGAEVSSVLWMKRQAVNETNPYPVPRRRKSA